jgi:hypothetical protein
MMAFFVWTAQGANPWVQSARTSECIDIIESASRRSTASESTAKSPRRVRFVSL